MMKTIHDHLLAAISKDGNQSRFADKHGLSRAYVSDMVRRRRDISPRIAGILGYKMTVKYERIVELTKIK